MPDHIQTIRIETNGEARVRFLYPRADQALRKARTLMRRSTKFTISNDETGEAISIEELEREAGAA